MKALRKQRWYYETDKKMFNDIFEPSQNDPIVSIPPYVINKDELTKLIVNAPELLDAAIGVNREFDDPTDAVEAFMELNRILIKINK